MSHQFIRSETAGGVTRITFNRPDVLNSFHSRMSAEVRTVLEAAESDAAVRVVLLTGSGRAFCAGQDLDEAVPTEGPSVRDLSAHVRTVYNPLVLLIRRMPKPVIAAVNGVAAGAGANLALACDFVLASRSASFIQAFSRIGLVPDTGGSFFLPRLVGQARATAMTMLAEKVTADRAHELGMIYRVTEPDTLLPEAEALATALAAMPTAALGLTKRLLDASFVHDLAEQLELEAQLQGDAGRTADFVEGVTAFREKRPPSFQGR